MDDIQERLEHYEGKDRERREREAEIMRIDLQLFVYARKQRYTLGDKLGTLVKWIRRAVRHKAHKRNRK